MQIEDIRNRLPLAGWRIGSQPNKTSVTLHYNGPSCHQSGNLAGWIQHMRDIAHYHKDVTNTWKSWQADGICYHYAVLPDGAVLQLRDDDAVLWHCGDTVGNAHSIAVHFPLGGNQQPTTTQWAACEALCDGLIARYRMEGRNVVQGHFEWSKSACPGPHLKRRLRQYRDEPPTTWFRPPRPYRTQTTTDVHQAPDGSRDIAMKLPAGTVVEIGALVPAIYRAWIANGTGFVDLDDLRRHPGVTLPAPDPTPITPDSRLLHPPRAEQQQVINAICSAPTGEYTRRDIEAFIVPAYYQVCQSVGIDPLLAIAQMCHETGNLTSWWVARPRRNPAGIGVTGAPGAGLSFPTWAQHAIPAHVGRLAAYATSPDQRSAAQHALADVAMDYRPLPTHLHGCAPTLAGLTGTWATDPDYAEKVATWAEKVRG
jgi:hypothetical protein